MSRKPLDKDLYEDVVAEAKERFDVWPSAYASGWVVKTYKARGGRYGGESKGSRTGLTKWFGESWVDLSRPIREDGEVVGYEPCGRKKSDDPADYPKCRPAREAMRMTPSEVRDAVKRKRAAEAKAAKGGRGGRGARAPVRVATYENPLMLDSVDDPLEPEFRRTIASLEPTRLALVYHGTSTAAFWPIVTSGLSFDASRKAWEGTSPGVFVAFDQGATDVYASRAMQTFGGTPICFVLEVPYEWLDTDIDDYLTHDKTRKSQAMVHKPIPSSCIVGVMLPEGLSWGPEIPIKRFIADAKKGEYESIGIDPPAKGKRFKLGAATRIDLEHAALNYLVDLLQYTSLSDVLLQPEWGTFQRKVLQALVSIPRAEWLSWNGRKWLAFCESIIGEQNEEPYAEQMLEEPRFKRSIGAVLAKYGFDDFDRDRILGPRTRGKPCE